MKTDDLSLRSQLLYGTTGLVIIALLALLVVFGVFPSHGGSTEYTAVFGNAGQGMDSQSYVKVRGIQVGTVTSVHLDSRGRAVVRFRVDSDLKLPETTVASAEPTSVFGPKEIDLDLGANAGTGPYLRGGGAVEHTVDAQELSDTAWPLYKLTAAINPDELAATVHTFASALSGEGAELNNTIKNSGTLLDSVYQRRGAIKQALTDVSLLAGTFSDRGDELVRLAADLNQISPVLTDKPENITALLNGGSKLTTSLNNGLKSYGDDLGPLTDSAGRAVNAFYQNLRDVVPMLNGLNGFFSGLDDIIRLKGPDGKLVASAVNGLSSNICLTLIDICGPYAKGAAK